MEQQEVLVNALLRLEKLEAANRQTSQTVGELVKTIPRLVGRQAVALDPASSGTEVDDDLVRWVEWLVLRYELGSTLPACWHKHGQLVEELQALRIGWVETVGVGEGGMAAMQWHDSFGRALDRIGHRWRTCHGGDHRDPLPVEWLERGHDPDEPTT